MAVTASTQGASATPATDFRTTLANLLTGAGPGWVETSDSPVSAVNAGTDGTVRVFNNAAATTVGSLITGVIILIEALDTASATGFAAGADRNSPAIRIRCAEQYDNSAHKVVYAASGITTINTSTTPNSNYAMSDAQQTIYQTPGTTATVGFLHLRTPAAGFSYWIGAEALRMLAATNGNGPAMAIAGRVETLVPSGDATAVHLTGTIGGTGTTTSCGWQATSTTVCDNVRTSREPLTTASTAGAFQFLTYGHITGDNGDLTVAVSTPNGIIGTAHNYFSTFVAHPLFMHGAGAASSIGSKRSYRAGYNGFIAGWSSADAVSGDTITIGGVAYIIVGSVCMNASTGGRCIIAVHPTAVF